MAVSAAAVSHDRREIKRAPVALANVSASGMFEGYASLFDTADLGRDVVAPGAFVDSLRRRGPAGVKMLWQHEASEPIGSWLSIKEDARGLKVRGRLNLAVARAREILALMREGAVDGLSIGFRTRRAVTDRRTGLRTLQSVDLWEISVVTFPMHPGARVTAVKRALCRPDPSLAGVQRELTRLCWQKDALALERGLQRLERRYLPEQPRDEIGRWTSSGGGVVSLVGQLAGIVIDICTASGISRAIDEFGNSLFTTAYECRDGSMITRSGRTPLPGFIIDPRQFL